MRCRLCVVDLKNSRQGRGSFVDYVHGKKHMLKDRRYRHVQGVPLVDEQGALMLARVVER